MTAKRFVDYFDKDHNYIIQDLQNEDEYQVGFVNCDEDVFLELINQLSDENEQLKTKNFAYLQDIEVFKEENTHLKLENEELKDFAQHNYSETKKIINNLQKENEQLKMKIEFFYGLNKPYGTIIEENRRLKLKNEELRERNDRQAKRLDNLYRLVEEKDWRTLSDILDDFKRCEEQLQREWRTYE